MRRWLLSLWVMCACAPSVVSVRVPSENPQDLCWWKSSTWWAYAPMRLDGIPSAIGFLGGSRQHPLTLKATLRVTGPQMTEMQGTLVSDQVSVSARVDTSHAALLHLTQPRDVGDWLHLSNEAPALISGGITGQPLMTLPLTTLRVLTPVMPVVVPERCENLTINQPKFRSFQERELHPFPPSVERRGLRDLSGLKFVKEEHDVELHETRGGPVVATMKVGGAVYVMDTSGAQTRIAKNLGEGVYVFAWVDTQALGPLEAPKSGGGGLGMLMGSGGSSAEPSTERFICTMSLPLGIRTAGQVHLWGSVNANVPVTTLTAPEGGWVSIKIDGFAFNPAKDMALVVPDTVRACSPLAPVAPPPTSNIFGPADAVSAPPPPQP